MWGIYVRWASDSLSEANKDARRHVKRTQEPSWTGFYEPKMGKFEQKEYDSNWLKHEIYKKAVSSQWYLKHTHTHQKPK